MMNNLRLAGMVGILLAVVLAAALQRPDWAHDLGLEEETLTSLLLKLRGTGHAPAKSHPGEQFFMQRNAAKKRVITAVLAGRLTLFEAASVFRRFNEDFPTVMACTFRSDWSEEECLCVVVIQWARLHLEERHSDAVDEVCACLEEQLRQHKELHGRVLLPRVVADEY